MDNQDDLDLDALLGVTFLPPTGKKGRAGVTVECGQAPPKASPKRFTEWNNFASFTFTGYVAKVTRFHCQCCDNLFDTLEGIFVEETHVSGSRRWTQLAPKGDWPLVGGHRKEVRDAEVPFCGHCIGDLGFDNEVDGHGKPYTNIIKGE